MILALDTDVLLAWLLSSHDRHAEARDLVERHLSREGATVALVPQVCFEFLHVVTDQRRMSSPMTMDEAVEKLREVGEAFETRWILPDARLVPRVMALLLANRLGRKRILDTALAATLEMSQVRHLASFNGRDYACFPFIEVVP